MTTTVPTLPAGIIFRHGRHTANDEAVCLLEAVSLPLNVVPRRGMKRSSSPPDVCGARAAFGRSLNDAYGCGDDADLARTAELGQLYFALRMTKDRNDRDAVETFLFDRATRDWFPRLLSVSAALLRAAGARKTCDNIDELTVTLRELRDSKIVVDAAASVLADDLAAPFDFVRSIVARAAFSPRTVRAVHAARATVDVADVAMLRGLHQEKLKTAAADCLTIGEALRREMADALLVTCRADFEPNHQRHES
jgi:hypothetical protein